MLFPLLPATAHTHRFLESISALPKQARVRLLAMLLLALTHVEAGVIPGRWEKVDALPQGARLAVIMKAGGEHIRGTFERSDNEVLVLTDEASTLRHIAKPSVKKVFDSYVADTKWDGLLIGGAIGAGAGAAIGPAVWGGEEQLFTNADAAALSAMFGALTGGLIGLVLDERRERTVELYLAREPAAGQVPPSDRPTTSKLAVDRGGGVR